MPNKLPSSAPPSGIVLRHATWLDSLSAAILSGLPKEGIVVDEAPLLIGSLAPQALRLGHEHYYFACGGGLGWGVPASVGIGLARPGARVLCVTGEGSTMRSPESFWNAAQRNLNIVFVVLKNGECGVPESVIHARGDDSARQNTSVGLDINQSATDFCAMGKAFGIRTLSIEGNDDVAAKVAEAFGRRGPTIIVIPVNR